MLLARVGKPGQWRVRPVGQTAIPFLREVLVGIAVEASPLPLAHSFDSRPSDMNENLPLGEASC